MSLVTGRKWLLFLALTILPGAPGLAQTPTRERPFPELREGRYLGPFLVDPSFNIDNLGWDGNIFLVPDGVIIRDANGKVIPRTGDFVIRMGPDVKAQLRLGQVMALTVQDRLGGEIFLKNADLNHFDNTIDTQVDLLFGPVLLTTKLRHALVQERPFSEIDQRTERREVDLNQGVRFFLSPKLDLFGHYARLTLDYRNPDREFPIFPDPDGGPVYVNVAEALNRKRSEKRLEIGYRPRRSLRFFVAGLERETDFERSQAGKSSDDRRALFGIEIAPSAFLSGKVTFGRAKLDTKDPATKFKAFDGNVAEATLVYRPSGTTRVTGKYKRDVVFSVFQTNLYYVNTLQSLDLETYLGGRWGLQGGASREDLAYPEKGSAPEPRRDELTSYYAGFLFQFRSGLALGIRYGVRNRDSNNLFARDKQKYITTTGSWVF